jgi:hypothetical protein
MSPITITFYCACRLCCGDGAAGVTASGVEPVPYVTIAAHRQVAFGTVARITCPELGWKAKRFVVHDRMSKRFGLDRVDVYVGGPNQHSKALKLGVKKGFVYYERNAKPK